MAYLLSGVAALIYIVAAVGLARAGHAGRRVALACCSVELVGVVGGRHRSAWSTRKLFPDETVWSRFGSGYGYIPLVLPVLGLLWLWRTRPAAGLTPRPATAAAVAPRRGASPGVSPPGPPAT